jgi:hypothetical protein
MHVLPPLPLRLALPTHHHVQRDLAEQAEVLQPPSRFPLDLLHQAPLRQGVHQPPRRSVRVRVQTPPQPRQDDSRLPGPGRRLHYVGQPVPRQAPLIPVWTGPFWVLIDTRRGPEEIIERIHANPPSKRAVCDPASGDVSKQSRDHVMSDYAGNRKQCDE